MAYNKLPDDLSDLDVDTTYRSNGVHQNRDSSAKMSVEPMDREGYTEAERQAMEPPVEPEPLPTATPIGVDERIATGKRDVANEQATRVGKATHAHTETVEPGQFAWGPTPGQGTQASYGDGAGVRGNMQDSELYNSAMSGAASGAMGAMGSGDMSGMGAGAGEGAMSGGMSAMSSQIGQDIASKDDSIDQATEALFQDDSDIEAMERLAEIQQGRG